MASTALVIKTNLYHFSRFHIYMLIYNIPFSELLHSIILSRSIHISTNDSISFPFITEQYSIIYTYHIFFIHSSVVIGAYTLLILWIQQITNETYGTAQGTLPNAVLWLNGQEVQKRGGVCVCVYIYIYIFFFPHSNIYIHIYMYVCMYGLFIWLYSRNEHNIVRQLYSNKN